MASQYAPSLKRNVCLDSFSKVKIKDSTEFRGSPSNADKYPGFNGCGTASCFQIQLELDLKNGKIEDLLLTTALNTDYQNAIDTIDSILPQELIIRDLGYISSESLDEIHNKKAFYLNKLKKTINLYDTDLNYISYRKLYNKLKKNKDHILEDNYYTGNRINHLSRVIYMLVPQQVYKKRIQELNKSRKGRAITIEERCRASMNILITNADAQRLPSVVAVDIYRLRWQIEIEFKSWKSTVKIASLKDTKTARTECYIFGRLIWLLIRNQTKILMLNLHKFHQGISIIKFSKMEKLKKELMRDLTGKEIEKFINNMLDIPEKLLITESKNTNKNAENYLAITLI